MIYLFSCSDLSGIEKDSIIFLVFSSVNSEKLNQVCLSNWFECGLNNIYFRLLIEMIG